MGQTAGFRVEKQTDTATTNLPFLDRVVYVDGTNNRLFGMKSKATQPQPTFLFWTALFIVDGTNGGPNNRLFVPSTMNNAGKTNTSDYESVYLSCSLTTTIPFSVHS